MKTAKSMGKKRTERKKVAKKKKQYFNDLLLPIIFTVCVLPFTVRLKEYEYGYSKYAWHSDESVMQDLYTWYRMVFFLAIAGMALIVLAFRLALYKEKNKSARVFLPFGIYLAFVALSCVFSINPVAAWLGNFVDLEGFFVLAGYGVIAFYTYQIMAEERDYATVFRGMEISFGIMSVFGWMQVLGKDPLDFPFIQRLIMSEEYYEYYEGQMYGTFSGNNVALSLYNPNYAVIYLMMFAAVFAVFLLFSEEKKQRILSGVFLLDALILTWFTYSRAGLVALAVVLVLCLTVFIKKKMFLKRKSGVILKYVLGIAGGVIGIAVIFVMVDMFAFGGHYMNRMIDEKKDTNLKSICTTSEGVEINYGEDSYLLSMEEDGETPVLRIWGTDGEECAVLTDAKDSYFLPIGMECEINFFEVDGENTIWVEMYDNLLTFVKRDGEYIYETSWGKEDQIVEVAHADAGGLEYLGSGRIYIWTRIVPLLKKYIFVGSGPDTFAEVFPQNDYSGKLVYAETPARIIERAHNDYLMKWVQTGLLSVAALLVFYFLLLKKGFAYFGDGAWMCSGKNLLALGCLLGCVAYMVCGLFSDSTLYTSPVFYVFVGIILSVVEGGGMEVLKRRIAIFLCMLMAISTVAAYLPAAQETAEASSWTYGFNSNYIYFSDKNQKLSEFTSLIVVEKGNTTLDLRDILYGYRDKDNQREWYTGTELEGIKFESRNADILSVDSKTGKINAKKTGTALVKITWKKKSIYGAIKVISKSDMKAYRTENENTIAFCKKIKKAYESKLTAKSALKVQKLVLQMYQDAGGEFYVSDEETNSDGHFVQEMVIYSMDTFHTWKKVKKVWSYLSERNPFTTSGSYKFEISSLSGSGKTVTATLSRAVTEDQMAGAQYNIMWGEDYKNMGKKSLTFSVCLLDKKTNKVIPATATIKTGSKTIKIKCDSSLTKGRKYELLNDDYSKLDWESDEWTTSNWIREDWLHNGKSTFKAT